MANAIWTVVQFSRDVDGEPAGWNKAFLSSEAALAAIRAEMLEIADGEPLDISTHEWADGERIDVATEIDGHYSTDFYIARAIIEG